MKRHIIILLITFLYLPEYLEAQLKYYDATEFPLYGKATKNTENRDKHPRTPIIFIEDPVFAHALFDKKIAIEINKKNKAVNSVFKSLKTKGEKNIYIISSEKMLGEDGEATVDGIHFTDLGMMRYADLVCPVIKKVLKKYL